MLIAVTAGLAGLAGLTVGSFLNVVIHRLPRGESIVRPRSRCPACETPIGPVDNIPVVSWLVLRGRCRSCAAPISARYPLVEAGTAALFAGTAARDGPGLALLAACVVLGGLVASAGVAWDGRSGGRGTADTVRTLGAIAAGAAVLSTPPILAGLVLGHRLTPAAWFAGGVVVTGILLVAGQETGGGGERSAWTEVRESTGERRLANAGHHAVPLAAVAPFLGWVGGAALGAGIAVGVLAGAAAWRRRRPTPVAPAAAALVLAALVLWGGAGAG